MSNKKYQVIYADPPWWYGNKQFTQKVKGKAGDVTSAADLHYPCMKTPDLIKEFGPYVEEKADDDCILFMWTSSPHLDQAIELGTAWGFKYKTIGFVWYKERVNPGAYTMSSVEVCLIFTKKGGKIPQPRGARNIRQYHHEKPREHSRKPDEFRKRIEKMFPSQAKLEMFCRERKVGWASMGNETEKFPEISDEPQKPRPGDQLKIE